MAFSLWTTIKGLLVRDETDKTKSLSLEIDSAATTNTQTTLKAAQTASRTIVLPDASDTLVGKNTTDVLTNKSIDADNNPISNLETDNLKAGVLVTDISLAVSNTELPSALAVKSALALQDEASEISYDNTTSGLTATDVQDAIDEVEGRVDATETGLANHLSDAIDAHDASAISNVPAGNIVATDVQSALNELDSDLTAHLNDATDAHDASAISNVPSGNLIATDVQAALNELQTDVDSRIPNSEKGASLGVATLDAGGKVPSSQLPNSVMEYQGTWNASTNTPTLADGVGNAGDVYIVSVAGTQDLGSGNITFVSGDWVMYNGTIWEKSSNSATVISVNGNTGVVTVNAINQLTGDVTAGPASGSQSQAATIANDAVSNAKLANMATQSIKGRTTAGSGDPEDLTATQATAILNNFVGDSGSGGTKGLVPAPASGDAASNKFLHADGTWTAVPASGANTTLSNLVGPTDINTDLTFDNSTARNIKIEDSAAATSGQVLTILSGNSGAGTNLNGGNLLLTSGSATGNGSSSIQMSVVPSGQGTGTTVRSPAIMATLSAESTQGLFKVLNPTVGSALEVQTSTENTITNATINSGSSAPTLSVSGAINTGAGAGGQLVLKTANHGSGNSANLTIQTGTATGTRGKILLKDGSEGAAGKVWTSSGVNGEGTWSSPSGNNLNIVPADSSSLDSSVGSWVAYADAAGIQPVDGTGGSPTVTATLNTSSPLNGTGSLRVTKDAANRQGEGASIALTVPEYIKGQPAKVSFSLKGSANFDFGTAFDSSDPSDVTVYLYDVTNSVLIQPYPYTLIANGIYEGMFQILSNCSSLRLILHVTTTNATSYTLDIDDVQILPALNEFVKSDSDLESYTPTYTGFGTVSASNIFFRKTADGIWIEGSFVAGTTTATEARMSLPTGLISKNSSVIPVIRRNGSFAVGVNTAQEGSVLIEPSVSYITFGLANGGAAEPLTKRNGSTVASSGNKISLYAFIPIQGFTSGNSTAASANLNAPVSFQAVKNGGAISANTTIPSWTTVNKDTVNAFNSSTGVYTVKVPGDYFISFNFVQTGTTTTNLSFFVNGSARMIQGPVATNGFSQSTGVLLDLKYGDQVTLQIGNALTASSSNVHTMWSMFKVELSGRVYSTRVAYIKDLKSSGTAGGTFTSGSYQTRTLNTLEGDTSFISLSSNQFTLQPGTYKIEANAPAYLVALHKAKLRNTTDSSDIVIGQSCFANTTDGHSNSELIGTFSITSAKTFEIQHRCQTTRATDGFGQAVTFGDSEIYTQVKIEKVL